MVKTLTLEARDNSLLIEVDRNAWAQCYLVEDSQTYLGAESIGFIASRLLAWLRDGSLPGRASAGEINGVPVSCLVPLAEAHHVLYVGNDGLDCLLFWQNARPAPPILAGAMRLSTEQRRQWQKQIASTLAVYEAKLVPQSVRAREAAEVSFP